MSLCVTLRSHRQWGAAAYSICGVPPNSLDVAVVDGTSSGVPPEGTPQALLNAGGLIHGGTGSGGAPHSAQQGRSPAACSALAAMPVTAVSRPCADSGACRHHHLPSAAQTRLYCEPSSSHHIYTLTAVVLSLARSSTQSQRCFLWTKLHPCRAQAPSRTETPGPAAPSPMSRPASPGQRRHHQVNPRIAQQPQQCSRHWRWMVACCLDGTTLLSLLPQNRQAVKPVQDAASRTPYSLSWGRPFGADS